MWLLLLKEWWKEKWSQETKSLFTVRTFENAIYKTNDIKSLPFLKYSVIKILGIKYQNTVYPGKVVKT